MKKKFAVNVSILGGPLAKTRVGEGDRKLPSRIPPNEDDSAMTGGKFCSWAQ